MQEGNKGCVSYTAFTLLYSNNIPQAEVPRIKSPIDMIKVFDESRRGENHQFFLIGVLNLNNMIPVSLEVIKEVDITIHRNDSPETKHYKELMQNQLSWCRAHEATIKNRANKVYRLVTENPDKNVFLAKRCLPFLELEQTLQNTWLIQQKRNKKRWLVSFSL